MAGGRLPDDDRARVRDEARTRGLDGGNHPTELGGRGWTNLEQVLVHEELGRNTNAIWWNMAGAYNVLSRGTREQIDRYLAPTLRGERNDAYAVTESGAGSDAGGVTGTAVRTAGGWHLRSEKWFVTSGDGADFFIVMVNVVDGPERLPTLFLVDRDVAGIEIVDDPPFTHNYPHGHPTIRFDCELPADAVLGGEAMVGMGNELQNEWFVEERIHIAARCVGAMRRLLEETVGWTLERQQFGTRIFDFQGVSFPLADAATSCMAARLLTYHVAQLADDPEADRKLVHHRASAAKLFASEAAYRCADAAVQAFGGRGYMRTNVAERFLRELRVDRIWEGTSEIQRVIVARGLEKRGVDALLDVTE
jgi:alkylation response protein AidB-like acyl-CoA dehydrogenase